jgi:GT2 family glycosyltransferase
MVDKLELPLSIVIATIGNRDLKPTLDSISKSSSKPMEVLLCVPSINSSNLRKYENNGTRIIICNEKGQVKQRIEGFKRAKGNYVLQLDDDIILDKYCLSELYRAINILGKDCAISPQYYDYDSNEQFSSFTPKQILLFPQIFYYLLNGKKGYVEGSISKSGINMGIKALKTDYFSSEWISGGCILHHRENLVIENYIPFTGKAYAEDIIHSYRLSQNNIKLFIIKKAKIYFKPYNNSACYIKTIFDYINSIKKSYYAASLYGASSARYRIAMYYYLVNVIVSKVIRIITPL